MKLKDLVANSLPRVRGRKKKTTAVAAGAAVPATVSSATAVVAIPETPSSGLLFDKNQNRYPSLGTRKEPQEGRTDGQGIAEASWRGNALYRGLERDKGMEVNSRVLASSYSSSHGIVTSHSAEGFSSQLMMISRSYDSRMTVSDYNGSCSQMAAAAAASVAKTATGAYPPAQQHYHCHYHRHNHHHYHHHIHSKAMTPLAQNQQELSPNPCPAQYLGQYKSEEVSKSEPGFFRKSIASFRSMRKSSKTAKDSKAKFNGTEQTRCSVCPYPETNVALVERNSSEKRPAKPKRKGLKGFSRFKENSEVLTSEKCDKSWYSDNDTHSIASPTVALVEASAPVFVPYEQSRVRECSVDSCSSRLYGSREASCVREIDLASFDSASLSGYESDLPRSKMHRSRSRIKTNPWLPSPQPSLSGERRGESCDLRESKEDIIAIEAQALRVPRSASFEHQKSGAAAFHMPGLAGISRNSGIQRHRSLTPIDMKMTLSAGRDTAAKSPSAAVTCLWWSAQRKKSNNAATSETSPNSPAALNDLNFDAPRSRPASIVSPNSEFVMLADNLEQLANNISFEYEDMLDSTLESVSVCPEDGQASIQELLTDEENGAGTKKNTNSSVYLKSGNGFQNAHSPDSGIGGLGSSDGDDALTPGVQTELKVVPMDCLVASRTAKGSFNNSSAKGTNPGASLSLPSKSCDFRKGNASDAAKSLNEGGLESGGKGAFSPNENECKINIATCEKELPSPFKTSSASGHEEDSSAPASESDIDNTSYQDSVRSSGNMPAQRGLMDNQQEGSLPVPKCKLENLDNNKHGSSSLMVEERLDIQFQPPHRHFHGSGVVMGTLTSARDFRRGVGLEMKSPYRFSDPTDAFLQRVARPNVLKTNPSVHNDTRRLNDMEKGSGEQGRPWSEAFDFPLNITLVECVDSPTENWQCDGQPMWSSQDTVILEQVSEASAVCYNEPVKKKFENVGDRIQNEEEVVVAAVIKTDAAEAGSTSENASLMDCNLEKLDTDSHQDTSFEMSDACVQTDFNDDFSTWDEVETLESLEGSALDPVENTRIWLLTGNMQGSADTGYSSLTRDSQILMDDDTLFLAGELEEKAAAERLSFGENVNKNKGDIKMARNSINIVDNKQASPLREIVTAGNIIGHANIPFPNKSSQIKDKEVISNSQEAPLLPPEPKASPLRSIPKSVVNQMFYKIENQFQEIFQQIHARENSITNTEDKRHFSDSSDSTLKSHGSVDPVAGEIFQNSKLVAQESSIKDLETGEVKNSTRLASNLESNDSKFEDHDYVNVPSSKPRHCSDTDVLRLTNQQRDTESRGKQKPVFSTGPQCPVKSETREFSSRLKLSPGSDRADYLEFLRDAPLDRSHLKRPLFLVPGIGPVDMSSSEQVNMFAEPNNSTPLTKPSLVSGQAVACSASPSMAHYGKKLKCKRGEQKSSPQNGFPPENIYSLASSNYKDCSMSNPKFQTFPVLQSVQTQKRDLLCHNKNEKSLASLKIPKENLAVSRSPKEQLPLRNFKCFTSESIPPSLPHHHPSAPPASSTTAALAPPSALKPAMSSEELTHVDDATRSLAERVLTLRREKDLVYRKIQEAQQDEMSRQEQRLKLQKNIHVHRKEALLETLHELRDKLEEQRRKLKDKSGEAHTANYSI